MACVMVSILVSSVVDHGFELGSNQRLDNFYLLLLWLSMQQKWAKSKDWLARNQNNVPEWSDMSTRGGGQSIKTKMNQLNRNVVIIIHYIFTNRKHQNRNLPLNMILLIE